jgi:hypothetical protein
VKRAAIKRLELQLQARDGDMLEKTTQVGFEWYLPRVVILTLKACAYVSEK